MSNFLYRFRTVERLIGNDKSEGELAGQYIYFASPEQLNDPLEGHRELFFSGDEVVWRNLFKHYFFCLVIRNLQFLTSNDFQNQPFPTHHQIREMTTTQPFKKIMDTESFLNHKNIKEHIRLLAREGRQVSRDELAVHLRSIHLFAVSLIVKVLSRTGIQHTNKSLSGMSEEHSLKSSTALLEQISEVAERPNINSVPGVFELMVFFAENEQFIKGYKSFKASQDSAWQSVSHNFVGDFLDNLKKLSHTDWYTACFMKSCSNYAIWGSYGDNHAGVCLVFKTDKDSEGQTLKLHMPVSVGSDGEFWDKHSLQFHEVKYEGESPPLDFFRNFGVYTISELRSRWYSDSEGNISACSDFLSDKDSWRESYWKSRQESLTTKMPDWKNENEYRLILENGLFNFDDPKKRRLKYDFNSLDSIIFGIKTSLTDKFKLASIVEKLCETNQRDSFTFHQAYHDTQVKCIKYRPLLTIKAAHV